MLNHNIKNPTPEQQNDWYNNIKVWYSPSELEGLHNPPIEAGLAGCALLCSDHKMSGTQDYAINGETALVYPAGNLKVAAKYLGKLMSDDGLRKQLNLSLVSLLNTKIGTRENNMKKLIETIK